MVWGNFCKPKFSGIILGMGSANERRRYIVTLSLTGWTHAKNDPWFWYISYIYLGHDLCNFILQTRVNSTLVSNLINWEKDNCNDANFCCHRQQQWMSYEYLWCHHLQYSWHHGNTWFSFQWDQDTDNISHVVIAKQGKSEGFESCDRPIVRKRPIWVKIGDVLSVWPWNLIDDLGKQ